MLLPAAPVLALCLLTLQPASSETAPQTDKICVSLTSKVEGATVKVARIMVKEMIGAETVDEYVIDLEDEAVSHGAEHTSDNDLTVKEVAEEEKVFKMKSTACGGTITAACGKIELPGNYAPNLNCTWTITSNKTLEFKFDEFEAGKGDILTVNGASVIAKPDDPTLGEAITIKFSTALDSDGKSKFKANFKEYKNDTKEEETPKKEDPNKCCSGKGFYFVNFPDSMKKGLGPRGEEQQIFKFKEILVVAGEKTSVYSNDKLDIIQKKSRTKNAGNYWQIGDQAWQIFLPEVLTDESKKITKDSCPDALPGWERQEVYDDMKAQCATDAELEKAGVCIVKGFWDATNPE